MSIDKKKEVEKPPQSLHGHRTQSNIANPDGIQYQNSHPAERSTSPHDLKTNLTQDLAGVGAWNANEPFDIDTDFKIEGIAHKG